MQAHRSSPMLLQPALGDAVTAEGAALTEDDDDLDVVELEDSKFATLPEWLIDAEISDRALRLYCVLARYANGERKAWPGRALLATRARCSVASVDRALVELRQIGAIITIERHGSNGRRRSNLHQIRFARAVITGEEPVITGDEGDLPTGDEENESHIERDSSPASPVRKRKTDPTSDEIVRAWWETQDPRPMQPYVAVRGIVDKALKAGWTREEIERALPRCDPPIVGWKLEKALQAIRGQRQRAEPNNPAASRFWEDGSR